MLPCALAYVDALLYHKHLIFLLHMASLIIFFPLKAKRAPLQIHLQDALFLLNSVSPEYQCILSITLCNYIIPIPGFPAGAAGIGSLIVATAASVVRKLLATLVAF